MLTRHVTDLAGGHPRTEVVYGITSLDAGQADAARLAVLVGGHWEIEDRLQWHRNIARGLRWAGRAPTRAFGLLGV